MKWAYDLCGAEPIIKDEIVYDAALVDQGELLMLGSGDFTAGAGQTGLITAYASTAGDADAANAVGISLEKKTTASSPSVATATDTTAEPCYAKVIINPFAVYRAEYVTAQEAAITSWTTTHLVIAGSASVADYLGWVYFSATGGPNYGELRLIVNTPAADTINVSSNVAATATTADKVIFIVGKPGYSNGLDETAVGVTACSAGTLAVGNGTNLRVVETYMDADTGFEILKQHKHYSGNKKKANSKPAKFYSDIVCKDHAYGAQE